jgi:hypothetical protein
MDTAREGVRLEHDRQSNYDAINPVIVLPGPGVAGAFLWL